MIYLFTLALLIVALGFAPERMGLHHNNHKNYLIICGFTITLVAGLRTYFTGSPDTYSYAARHFPQIAAYSDFTKYYDIYLDEHGFLFSEAGFHWCLWLLSRITKDGHVLVFLTTAFFTFSACRFIYKNSSDVPLSMMIYYCLGLFAFNMDCMRQAMAMSICMLGYEYVKKRKIIKFALVILIGLLFHKSALLFAPVYFLPMLKNTKGNIMVFLVCLVTILMSFDKLIPWFNEATGKEYSSTSGATSGGISVLLLYLFSLTLTFLVNAFDKPKIRIAFFCTVTAFGMYISRYFTSLIVERSSYYYYYFTILLIPEVIQELRPEDRKIVRMLFIFATLALYAYRIYVGTFRNFKWFF